MSGQSMQSPGMGAPAQGRQRQPTAGPQQPGRSQLKPVRVDDIVAEDVVTVEPDTPVRTAAAEMAENDVGSAVVVEDDEPAGLITDRSIALSLEETPDVSDRTVEELASGDVVTVDPEMNIFDVLQLMSDEEIRRLPVVDDEGTLQGIVTLDDALVLLGSEFSNVAETIQAQSPRL